MAVKRGSHKLTSGFASRLRASRVACGYTQEEFSRLLGIKRDRYAKYELAQAEPPFHILAKVSELANQSLDNLIGGRMVVGREALKVVGSQLSDIQAVSDIEAAWWWKSDREHRIVAVWHLHNHIPQGGQFARSLGKTRWDNAKADITTDEAWRKHLEDLEDHRVFENFRYSYAGRDGEPREVCVSGKPVFDSQGEFQGYTGFGYSSDSKGALTEAL